MGHRPPRSGLVPSLGVTQLVEIERQTLVANFPRESFPVTHHLVDHPLMTVDALADLADALPIEEVEHNYGDLPEVLPGGQVERADLGPGDMVRGLDSNQCWMALKQIQVIPEYNRLLDECLDDVAPYVNDTEGGMAKRVGFIFLSCPNSVTPAHFDPEHNFLLQVRGTKQMRVGRWPSVEAEQLEAERYFGGSDGTYGGHRNVMELPSSLTDYALGPGDGCYVPFGAPHWVQNGPTVSYSLSITWKTPFTMRAERVHAFNRRLRRLGLKPAPPGRSERVDKAKAAAVEAWGRANDRLRPHRKS